MKKKTGHEARKHRTIMRIKGTKPMCTYHNDSHHVYHLKNNAVQKFRLCLNYCLRHCEAMFGLQSHVALHEAQNKLFRSKTVFCLV